MLLQKAEGGLKKVSDGNMQIVENKHILAYGKYYFFYVSKHSDNILIKGFPLKESELM